MLCQTTMVIGEELTNELYQRAALYNVAIREIAFANGALVVDINAAFHDAIQRAQSRNPDFHYTIDGTHPNMLGTFLMCMTLLKTLHFTL